MDNIVHIEAGEVYISKRYLKNYASPKTIECWNPSSGVVSFKNGDNQVFFLYKTIPLRTRRKLPEVDKIVSEEKRKAAYSKIKGLFHDAFYYGYTKYRHMYEAQQSFETYKITKFSRLHSVFQTIIDLKKRESFKSLTAIHEVFNEFFPGKYKTKEALSQAILKATVNGPMSVALDKRAFGNNEKTKKETTPQIEYVLASLISSDEKFSNPVMLEKANSYFKEHGLKEMSLSWMKKQRVEFLRNPEVYKSRYGSIETKKIMPYASMKHADYVHSQWQVDGWTLPFWETRNNKGFHRSVLVCVIDNCSKKIVGYSIGDSENSETIKNAIRDAVSKTGVLPFEMVMDNHSFTKTDSALTFEAILTRLGGELTLTLNPQHKSIIERFFGKIDDLFKLYPGWIGKSVRAKSIEDNPSAEKFALHAKHFKQRNEVLAYTVSTIEKYNSTELKIGKSPNDLYLSKPHPSPLKLNLFHQAALMPNESLKLIRRGQINFTFGTSTYEFQLPARFFEKLNNQTVLVKYDDIRDGIYLFDQKTREGLVHLLQKSKIRNAKHEQQPEDIELLYKNKGRLSGIIAEGKNKVVDLTNKALNQDPEAHVKVNALVTPKSIISELERDSRVKALVHDKGINIDELSEIQDENYQPVSLSPSKKDSNPFKSGKGKIEVFKPKLNQLDEDEAND